MNATEKSWTINDIKTAVRSSGSHWFDPDTMRFFRCRVGDCVYQGPGGIYFVTSERSSDSSPRLFSVRQYIKPGDIETVGKFNSLSRAAAVRIAKKLAATDLQAQFDSAMCDLDRAVTGDDKSGNRTKYGTIADAAEGGSRSIIYLSDGGYTRLLPVAYENENGFYLRMVDAPESAAEDRKKAFGDAYELQSRVCDIIKAFATDSYLSAVTAESEIYQPVGVSEQFLADLRAHGCKVSREDARTLRRLATRHRKMMEDYCNGREIYDSEGEPRKPLMRLRHHAAAICARLGCSVKFSGDPRGATVKLVFADGATNDFGKEGWVVPTIGSR